MVCWLYFLIAWLLNASFLDCSIGPLLGCVWLFDCLAAQLLDCCLIAWLTDWLIAEVPDDLTAWVRIVSLFDLLITVPFGCLIASLLWLLMWLGIWHLYFGTHVRKMLKSVLGPVHWCQLDLIFSTYFESNYCFQYSNSIWRINILEKKNLIFIFGLRWIAWLFAWEKAEEGSHSCLLAWLIDCLITWLLDYLIAWLRDCWITWLLDCLLALLIGSCLIAWLLDWLIAWWLDA